MKTQLSIYPGLNRADVRCGTKKDETETTIHFDRYECRGYIGDKHKIDFYLNEIKVAEVKTQLKNVLEVGEGAILLTRMKVDPRYYMTPNQKSQVEAGTLTIRQAIEQKNPTQAKFCIDNGIF